MVLSIVGISGAQERFDSTFLFRFVQGKDMFYVPWNGNGAELERLLLCVERNRTEILEGLIPVYVDGYCTSQATEGENLAMAKIRSNRVKSELILRGGITESCFVTHNHASEGDFVTVRIVVPMTRTEELSTEEPASVAEPEPGPSDVSSEPAVPPVEESAAVLPAPDRTGGSFSLRANLLRWATLTPDIGLEWRISRTWAVTVNGSWTSWSWDNATRRYALWEVAPEVRCYLGEKRAWYVGAMFKTGAFNYKLSDTGKQGDLIGGGITAGYQLRLNKALSLDFSLGLGYLNADYEKYEVIDGVRVRRSNETKGWWGPVNAGITLKWNLF